MVMDVLPKEVGHWQANALYILGDRAVLQDVPEDLYPSCTFAPVEVSPLAVGLQSMYDIFLSLEPLIFLYFIIDVYC